MELNRTLIGILTQLNIIGDKAVRESITISDGGVDILSHKDTLVRVGDDSIKLFGEHDIQTLIIVDVRRENTVHPEKIKAFFEAISKSILRLNHVGIGYSCQSYQGETRKFIEISTKTNKKFCLFDEDSGGTSNKWFFIGDRSGSPLFELVLTESKKTVIDKWTPQFQIDIDTSLEPGALESICTSIFGTGFDWCLDIPGKGILLYMKILGSINGTKICLGVGTSKRDTRIHRENELKELS